MRRRKHIYFPVECFFCGVEIPNRYEHTYDHIVPLARGGRDRFDNLVDCCYRCNQLKADLTLEEFYAEVEAKFADMGERAPQYAYFLRLRERLGFMLGGDSEA